MANKVPRKTAEEAGSGSRLSDVAYSRILEALFDRRLPAGAFVSQKEIVELTGIPVAPVRDALRVLEVEGVLVIHPRTGIQLLKPGLEVTKATYQFRSIIEAAAVASYAATASEQEIDILEQRHANAVAEIEKNGLHDSTLAELEELEDLLHGSIVASLNNSLIDASYRRARNYIRLIRLDRKLTPPLVLRSLREHRTIIEACRQRDAKKAVAALQSHFTAALQRGLGLY
jgi:DNA-binding GntR family transcriptional regulator